MSPADKMSARDALNWIHNYDGNLEEAQTYENALGVLEALLASHAECVEALEGFMAADARLTIFTPQHKIDAACTALTNARKVIR